MGITSFKEHGGAIFRQLREDAVMKIFLPVLVLVNAPYFFPGIAQESMETFGYVMPVMVLFPFAVFALWPRQGDSFSAREVFFWKALAVAFSGWWLSDIVYLFYSTDSLGAYASVAIVIDSIFLVYYGGWLIAASTKPHASRKSDERDFNFRFLMSASLVLAFGLFSYFALIPRGLTPDVHDSWMPSLIFYTVVDVILVVLFVCLTTRIRTLRWRVLYALLAAECALVAVLDLLESLDYHWALVLTGSVPVKISWSLPFLFMVVIARARYFKYPETATDEQEVSDNRGFPKTGISPIIMASFVLPVAHIVLDQLGFVQGAMKNAQTIVVLVSLVVFWVLAILENISLRVSSQRARAQAAELEELRVRQAVSERAEKAKGRFLANISHEIRTPMNGILGMSEILLRGNLEDEQRYQATLLKTSAQEMVKIVDDILDYSRIEAGELSLVMEAFRLDRLAGDVIDLFAATQVSNCVEMILDIQDDVPLELEGDASRLRQVLVNLVSNAVKFTTEGEVRLQISLRDRSSTEARIFCKVSDTGIGIEPAEAEKLFLPFTQGDESSSRGYGGIGLGLSISKQIIEAHGGEIGTFGDPGEGSVFWFEVPLKLARAQMDIPVQPASGPTCPDQDRKILLAEDDEVNSLVALKQIELLGYKADVARDGNEVLDALEQHSYALILMDCQMPSLDGLQATRLIREKGYTQSELPIIALTANAFDEDREACLECGMNDFITKPAELEHIRAVLAKWL